MVSPKNAGINSRVAEFAWRVKNWMRPLGLSHLGLPCQLMGTGMAFPWHVIRSADLAQGLIVEDLQLGLDLAKAGHAPIFCPFARVTSEFASSAAGVATQRARWEHGHIQTILKMVPALLWQSIKGKNTELLALTLDLVVPPLSLLVMLTGGMFLLGSLGALFGFSRLAVFISTGSILSLVIATIFAWLKCGREVLPARSICRSCPI